jgi:hypothetical protein
MVGDLVPDPIDRVSFDLSFVVLVVRCDVEDGVLDARRSTVNGESAART